MTKRLRAREEEGRELSAEDLQQLRKDRDVLRAELNLAKWASFIFAPSHTPKEARVRTKTWVTVDEATGNKVIAKVFVDTVGNAQTLTSFDYRTSLALEKCWWDRPRTASGHTPIRLRDLAKLMQLGWGKKTYLILKASLRRLRQVPITWRNAFVDARTGHAIGPERTKNILSDLILFDRYPAPVKGGGVTAKHVTDRHADHIVAASCFRFDEAMEHNLLSGRIKPVFFDVAMGLRGEIALSLYSFLDVVMAKKSHFERRITQLLHDDLTVRGTYSRPAERRRLVKRATQELEGRPISTGVLHFEITRTKDDEEDKLIVTKQSFRLLGKDPAKEKQGKFPFARTRRRNLDEREVALVDEIVELTSAEGSRANYALFIADYGYERMRGLYRETVQANRERQIKTTPARYLGDLIEEARGRRPERRGGSVSTEQGTSPSPSSSPQFIDGVLKPATPAPDSPPVGGERPSKTA